MSDIASSGEQNGVVSDYFGFIDTVGQRIRHGNDVTPPSAPLLNALPGLSELFSTFPVASETARYVGDRKIEDWNPLGQRLLLPDSLPAPASEFETEFSLLTMSAQTLVEWAHEAIHILAVEHWTTGQVSLRDEAEFKAWYLAAEGLAFWYADIVVTRAIRQSVPNAELVYSRSAVSNAGFHPEEAFRQVGIGDADALCELYVSSFLGRAEALCSSTSHLAQTYGKRLTGFYRDSGKTLNALWNILHDQEFLGGYWEQFCNIPGLPCLLRDAPGNSVAQSMETIGKSGMPGLADLSPAKIDAVRLRRSLQVRAWHGWALCWMLKNNWTYSLSQTDISAVMGSLPHWLNQIEKSLLTLSRGDLDTAHKDIEALDFDYEAKIAAPLTAARVHGRYRYWIFPFFAPTGGLIGLWDNRSGYQPHEARAVLKFVAEKAGWSAQAICAQAAALEAIERADEEPETARARFNEAMLIPEMRDVWSIPIWKVSPSKGAYRELAFEFH